LLEGDEPWLSVESTQYYDVRGEKFPDAKFYSAVGHVVSPPEGPAVQLPVDAGKPVKPKSAASAPKFKTGIAIGIIGVIALLAVVIPIIWSSLSKNSAPPPTDNVTSPSATVSSNAPLNSNPTSVITSVIPGNALSVPDSDEIVDSKGVSMRLVSAGEFSMGSGSGDTDEVPVHPVYLDAYYIDKYEITNSQYKECVLAGACYKPNDVSNYENSQYADHPVLYLDWDMAKTYCGWRGAQLPTEAQWEKAARGTDGRTYPWGEGIDCSKANYLSCTGSTSDVTTHQSGISPYGVFDMAGNVWEWVADWYSENYYETSPAHNPTGPDSGTLRVLRSGAWNVGSDVARTSLRNAKPPSSFDNDIGFRCAKDANS
jgi:formylglycine-generating enzyme required for sulfatase activity